MHLDLFVALGSLVVGFVVGLTGMGGGALMTPMLVLVFHTQPLTAVSSDLVASFVMKPIGGGVHLRRGTVNRELVRWLVTGSVPTAFAGVFLIRAMGGDHVQSRVKLALGIALLIAASLIVVKAVVQLRRDGVTGPDEAAPLPVRVRPGPTMAVGALGGLVVGMTSVGSGSLIIVMLLFLYPTLKGSQLVGTDLVQAIPLVGAAALAHLLFGDFQLSLTTSLLLGAIPGVYFGAHVSVRAPDEVIRPALAFVLSATALKLLGTGNTLLGVLLVPIGAGCLVWGMRANVARSSKRAKLDRITQESVG
jgi:uncharacterized membrane protein YfcA